jgi:hypothetical protein
MGYIFGLLGDSTRQEASSSVELLIIKGHGPEAVPFEIFWIIFFFPAVLSLSSMQITNLPQRVIDPRKERLNFRPGLCYVRLAAPEFLFDHLHLVFQAKLELFNAHFFQLFIFRKISFFNQGGETLGVLIVFLGQPTKFFVAGKKLFANGVYHPDEPPA